MPSLITETLILARALRDLIAESPLASAEDANYFRSLYKKKTAELPSARPPAASLPPISVEQPILKQPQIAPLLPEIEKIPSFAPEPRHPPVSIENTAPRTILPEKREPSFDSLFTLFSKISPQSPPLREIPSDEKARKIANRWKTKNQSAPISILSYAEPPEHKKFLEQIALAIDVYFGPARLICVESIEKEKQWDAFLSVPDLKLILCCDYALWQLTDLMRYFKEIPASSTRYLGKTPLFLLPDLSLYLKDSQLKRSLWRALCQTIRSL